MRVSRRRKIQLTLWGAKVRGGTEVVGTREEK